MSQGEALVTALLGELVFISGRYRGRRVPLNRDLFRIGRDRTCELHLDDEAASRVHSEIARVGDGFVLRDLRSTNGTYLNDARVTESPLQNGDRIAVGDTVMLLQLNKNGDRPSPAVVFTREPKTVGTRISLSVDDTRFLKLNANTTIPDAERQFSLLYEFMVDVSGILHLPALLDRSLSHFLKAFNADRGLILLLTPDGEPGIKVTRVREGVNDSDEIAISRTMANQLLEKRESFISFDASSDERLAGAESLHSMHVYSIMGAPLKVKDKIIGMMYFDTRTTGKQFSEDDLRLCTAMALQLSVCLENTRLYNELLDAAEFNNSILRSLKSGLVVLDMKGRILRINRATQETLARDETQLLGRTLGDFPEYSELHQVVQNTMSSGLPEDRFEAMVRVGEDAIPLGVTTSVLTDHTGKVIGVVANFRNLALVRKLEEQVRRSQHLASLGQMAAGVAHEIRNPLNSIRGFTQLLQEKISDAATHAEYTRIILEEVDRMNGIVQDLLDFSRQRDLTLVPVLLPELISDLVRDMQPDSKKCEVELKLIQPESVLPGVLGNCHKLRQVFRNIVMNGMQACKPGGSVTISLSLVTEPQLKKTSLPETPTVRNVAVVISDTGCGIETESINKVFDPFFTQKESGTGLGLSISQKIVDQHGGRIEVQSEIGKGSVFTVLLPAV